MQFGSDVKPAAGQTVTFKADKGTVNATKMRIVNTVNNDYMNATEIQAFVTPVQGAAKNIAAASGTNFSVNFQEGASASKAIDGDTTSKGWSTWASTASTVDPVATFTFDEAQTITEVKTFFYYVVVRLGRRARRWNTRMRLANGMESVPRMAGRYRPAMPALAPTASPPPTPRPLTSCSAPR